MSTIWIKLEIEGDADDAMSVVDTLLDNGGLQDLINDHEHEDCGPLRVTSALADFDAEKLAREHAEWQAQETHKAVCAECQQEVNFGPDGQPLTHDDGRTGKRCDASPLVTS